MTIWTNPSQPLALQNTEMCMCYIIILAYTFYITLFKTTTLHSVKAKSQPNTSRINTLVNLQCIIMEFFMQSH
jgi:hypothetical protein